MYASGKIKNIMRCNGNEKEQNISIITEIGTKIYIHDTEEKPKIIYPQ